MLNVKHAIMYVCVCRKMACNISLSFNLKKNIIDEQINLNAKFICI